MQQPGAESSTSALRPWLWRSLRGRAFNLVASWPATHAVGSKLGRSRVRNWGTLSEKQGPGRPGRSKASRDEVGERATVQKAENVSQRRGRA